MSIPVEDTFVDILSKAMRGLHLSESQLAEKAGVSTEVVHSLREGTFNEATARAVAPSLNLNADALVSLGRDNWRPEPVEIPGLAVFNTAFDDITVNAYLVWDSESREAVAFDTGSDCQEILDLLQAQQLKLRLILLTHSHGDHIYDLDRLKEKTRAPAWASHKEQVQGAKSFDAGHTFEVGSLKIETRQTWGHSRGGVTYVVQGLARPVAIVGDAVFAGSMGGGNASYEAALETNRKEIMSLPDDTVLCPGHGPLTTVREEKQHNAFLAGADQ